MENKKYQVFVSSTFTDLEEERNKVLKTLLDLNCIPAGMEYFPSSDEEQMEYIKRIIDESDYYVLIIGGRYGSIHPEKQLSYTELEYEYAKEQKKPILSFLHKNPESIPQGKTDSQNKSKLDEFITTAKSGRMTKFWGNSDELAGMIATSLIQTFKTTTAKGWIREGEVSNKELLEENHGLRKEISELHSKFSENSRWQNTQYEQESDKYRRYWIRYILDNTLNASEVEINNWLDGYNSLGKTADNHLVRRLEENREVRLVDAEIYIPPLYGAKSMIYIVQIGVKIRYLDDNIGHSSIYFMDGFRYEGLFVTKY